MPRRLQSHVWSWLFLGSLLILTATALTSAQKTVGNLTLSTQEPVTLHARFQFPDDPLAAGFDGVWLAGLSTDEIAPFPNALGLKWALDASSWVPVWSLQLHSDAGLLPGHLTPGKSPDMRGADYVTLANIQPKWGAVYETQLSYDPSQGRLSIWVNEALSETPVYAQIFDVPKLEIPTTPTAGYIRRGFGDAGERFTPLADVQVYGRFIPRAVEWYVTERIGGELESLGTTLIDRSRPTETVLFVKSKGVSSGTFHFSIEVEGKRSALVTLPATGEDQIIDLPLDTLPLGPFRLVMEYVDAGEVWFSSAKDLRLGKIEVSVSHIDHVRDQNAFKGTLTLRGDDDMQGVRVRVTAELSAMVWNGTARRFYQEPQGTHMVFDEVVALSPEATELPFSIAAPENPGLWQLRFWVDTWPDVTEVIHGTERLVGTYAPPELSADEPFTIAILPDTQRYSYVSPAGGYPDIFIRQLQWLAEQAATEKIALMLHVGDITQHNAPPEWEVAQKSIYLLDGVMPYVLAIGNHDMGNSGIANDRTTLFNNYFPLSRYESHPWFGGTFEPGRLENSYSTFSIAGRELLVISLEFLPRDAVLEWANHVVGAHPDHFVIVVTHRHTGADGLMTASPGSWNLTAHGGMNAGVDVWNKFLRHHPNIRLVFSGHIYHDAMPRGIRRGVHGNAVFEMLSDFSGGPNGGTGWLVLVRFFPDHDRLGVSVYSPFLGETKYDATDGFYVPFCIDLAGRRYVTPDDACVMDMD